ncbi:MAG: hypothetical protein IJK35_02650 [Oscillospiraceae bacterium]|nr:hypothetical protein [Oscillospiraceae bacterium]
MKPKAADFLLYDEASGLYRENPEQAVRDDVEKHYWLHVGRSILKDWRLYLMLIPMLLVFLFWRYFPMYELLGCFKVSDEVSRYRSSCSPASLTSRGCWWAVTRFRWSSGAPCATPSS